MVTVLTIAVVVFSILILSCLFVLHRAVVRLHDDLRRLIVFDTHARERESSPENDSKVPRQIVHDLNNLLSTMGGFAEAALEDVTDEDPIRSDLREISDAADRAKGVVKRLSDLNPQAARFDSSLSMSELSALKRVTSTYEIPKDLSSDRSATPTAKPVSAYRRESRPPMVTPVPSTSFSSYPPPARLDSTDDIRTTSSFPAQIRPPSRTSIPFSKKDSVSSKAKTFTPQRDLMRDGAKPRLMIVDDEIQLLTMFRRVFEPQGYDVTTYSDSLEAWNAFRKDSKLYDLAILDQRMPEMSGSSLATEMIAIRPDFPIILLTGYSDNVSPDDAARIGIRKYLSKPIPQAKLSATIRSILNETSL